MSRLISVDPGINGCAYAVWAENQLIECGIAKVKSTGNPAERAYESAQALVRSVMTPRLVPLEFEIAIEYPQVYREGRRGSKANADPNQLLPLAGIASVFVMYADRLVTYLPREWKGQLPKAETSTGDYVVDKRVIDRLSTHEVAKYTQGKATVAKSLQHNVVDAVGIGLHHLGRFERKRIYPR